MRLPRALAAAVLTTTFLAVPVAGAQANDERVFVRVTFICKATQDGEPDNTPGFSANSGDYIYRYRNEGDVNVSWTSGVGGTGLHSGSLDVGQVQYAASQTAVNGVSVKTEPGPNGYRGTASANETPCAYTVPTPTPTPTPTDQPEPTDEPVPTAVPAGRSDVGTGVDSAQLAGLAAVATVGVAGAYLATRGRRQQS